MGLHRRLAELERTGQLGIAQAAGEQGEHLAFPGGERGQVTVQRRTARVDAGEALHQPAGDRRGKQRVALLDQPDRVNQMVGADNLDLVRPGS